MGFNPGLQVGQEALPVPLPPELPEEEDPPDEPPVEPEPPDEPDPESDLDGVLLSPPPEEAPSAFLAPAL